MYRAENSPWQVYRTPPSGMDSEQQPDPDDAQSVHPAVRPHNGCGVPILTEWRLLEQTGEKVLQIRIASFTLSDRIEPSVVPDPVSISIRVTAHACTAGLQMARTVASGQADTHSPRSPRIWPRNRQLVLQPVGLPRRVARNAKQLVLF